MYKTIYLRLGALQPYMAEGRGRYKSANVPLSLFNTLDNTNPHAFLATSLLQPAEACTIPRGGIPRRTERGLDGQECSYHLDLRRL